MMDPMKGELDFGVQDTQAEEEILPPETIEKVANMIRQRLAQDFMKAITTNENEPEIQS
jgi:hypothetical protein